ncbi:hypothetical protein QJQ45_026573, partial [Haematococcus lacustris]
MSLLGAAIVLCMVIATACSAPKRDANIAKGRQLLQVNPPPHPPPPSPYSPPLSARGTCTNPVMISNVPSNGVLNIPFEERSCQDMTDTWQPPAVYDNVWYGFRYAVWSVGYFLPGDAPVHRLITLSAGGPGLSFNTFIRYGWCANAGRCNLADLCPRDVWGYYEYFNDYQARYASSQLSFTANPGQDYFIVLFSHLQYVNLGSCANPFPLTDLPLNGQLTLTPGPRSCSDMTRSMNLYWGSSWDVGYLLPGDPTWHRQFTVDTCLPGVPGNAVGFPMSLAVTALASTSGLCRLASTGLLGYLGVVTSANGCGGSLNFAARVGQAYLITVSAFTPGFVMRDPLPYRDCQQLRCTSAPSVPSAPSAPFTAFTAFTQAAPSVN